VCGREWGEKVENKRLTNHVSAGHHDNMGTCPEMRSKAAVTLSSAAGDIFRGERDKSKYGSAGLNHVSAGV
jgi:hypothetical protein